MPGVTVVDVDEQGRVTRWRDYFDMKSVEEQIRGNAP
jgi:limonene-1,2-epoxide hydrolase